MYAAMTWWYRPGLVIALVAGGSPVPPAVDAPPVRPLLVLRAPERSPSASVVGVIGDSTGSQLAAELHRRHVSVVVATVGGCQSADLVLTYQDRDYFENHRRCAQDAREYQDDLTFRFRPKIVIWSDAMEWSDIKRGKRIVAAGSDEWKRLMSESLDRTLGRLGKADVALVLPTWWAGWPVGYPASFPVDGQRALFRTWAGRHADRVAVIDLGPVICPSGPPCGQVVGGVRLRVDSLHYTPEGARRALDRIMAGAPALAGARKGCRPGSPGPCREALAGFPEL